MSACRAQAALSSNPGIFFLMSTTITLTGGTMFCMWLGEQITSRGIGNGISLIILSGIVAQLPQRSPGRWNWADKALCRPV